MAIPRPPQARDDAGFRFDLLRPMRLDPLRRQGRPAAIVAGPKRLSFEALESRTLLDAAGALNDTLMVQLSVVQQPSPYDVAAAVPQSVEVAPLGSRYYAEVWVQDLLPDSPGIVGGQVNLSVTNDRAELTGLGHGGIFRAVPTGTVEQDDHEIRDFGGGTFDPGVGVGYWARLGYVQIEAVAPGQNTVSTGAGVLPFARTLGGENISWDDVAKDASVTVEHIAPQVDLRVVEVPSDVGPAGQVDALPESVEYVHEWQSYWVEIYVTDPDSVDSAVLGGSVSLLYDTHYATATQIEYGPAFVADGEAVIDDARGVVRDISARATRGDLGNDEPVLLARVRFQPGPQDQVVFDPLEQEASPHDLKIEAAAGQFELAGFGTSTARYGEAPETDVFAVVYDTDDNDQIDAGDLARFSDAYGLRYDSNQSPWAWWADLDKTGPAEVDSIDYAYLAGNLGLGKADGDLLFFPASYPDAWDPGSSSYGHSGSGSHISSGGDSYPNSWSEWPYCPVPEAPSRFAAADESVLAVTAVATPTPTDDVGQVDTLPDNASWFDEWQDYWVEVWVRAGSDAANTGSSIQLQYSPGPNAGPISLAGSGNTIISFPIGGSADAGDSMPWSVSGAMLDLNYSTDHTTAVEIEYGPAFTQSQTGAIDDNAGRVDNLGAATTIQGVGNEQYVLLARVRFVSAAHDQGLPVMQDGRFGAVPIGLEVADAAVHRNDKDGSGAYVKPMPGTAIRCVQQDANDDDIVDGADYELFAAHFGERPFTTTTYWSPNNEQSPPAGAYDYDGSNRVDFADFGLLTTRWLESKPGVDLQPVLPVFPEDPAFLPQTTPAVPDRPVVEPYQPPAVEPLGLLANVVLVAVPEATPADWVAELPQSTTEVELGERFVVEAWVQDVSGFGAGITGGTLDVRFPGGQFEAAAATAGGQFPICAGGFVDPAGGLVDELGGASLESDIGRQPAWARLGSFELEATQVGAATIAVESGDFPLAMYGLGNLLPEEVAMNDLSLEVVAAAAVPADEPAWHAYKAAETGFVFCEATTSDLDRLIHLTFYDGNQQELTSVAIDHGYGRFEWEAEAGDTFYVRVMDYGADVTMQWRNEASHMMSGVVRAIDAAEGELVLFSHWGRSVTQTEQLVLDWLLATVPQQLLSASLGGGQSNVWQDGTGSAYDTPAVDVRLSDADGSGGLILHGSFPSDSSWNDFVLVSEDLLGYPVSGNTTLGIDGAPIQARTLQPSLSLHALAVDELLGDPETSDDETILAA